MRRSNALAQATTLIVIFVAALGVFQLSGETARADVAAPTYDECYDDIDNDEDGTIDATGEPSDEGCDDKTPLTEKLSEAPTEGMDEAYDDAYEAVGDYYGDRFGNADDDWFNCWRKSRVRVNCRYGFVRRMFVYSGVIRLYSYKRNDTSHLSAKRRAHWKQREPQLRGADEVTILKCTRDTCSMRLTYYG